MHSLYNHTYPALHYITKKLKRLHYFLSNKYIGNNFRHIFGHKYY